MREHDATFQFFGTRIGALTEVNKSRFCPEIVPKLLRGLLGIGETEGSHDVASLVSASCEIFHLESQMVFIGRERESMCCRLSDFGLSLPSYVYIIGCAVETVLDFCVIGILNEYAALVAVRLRPVGSIIGMFASRIG